ncbi:MAG: hypothetical protein K9H49_13470 [Bacteroidales bacterium]|nr:hypothetical protein [Bacteroidales bacterium]MCF8391411.1 hypothetical protein [Bacteroidales bacterium]
MNNSKGYKILPELNLIVDYYSGPVNLNDIINLKKIEGKDPEYSPNRDVINDFIDCEFNFTYENVIKFVKYVENNQNIVGKRKVAFLTQSPHQVTLTLVYKLNAMNLPMIMETFTTLEAAMNWIGISENYIETIESTINEFNSILR